MFLAFCQDFIEPHDFRAAIDYSHYNRYAVAVLGQGKLMGRILPQDTALFTGIPFARPPTGDHRWRKPRQAVPFEHDGEYYDATNHRAGCPQNCSRVLPGPETSCPDERKVSPLLNNFAFDCYRIVNTLIIIAFAHRALVEL